jgi:hypothetical protein
VRSGGDVYGPFTNQGEAEIKAAELGVGSQECGAIEILRSTAPTWWQQILYAAFWWGFWFWPCWVVTQPWDGWWDYTKYTMFIGVLMFMARIGKRPGEPV